MKATDLLEKQHRKVEAIFKKLEGGGDNADELLTELATDLAAHMAIEQEIFYPAVKAVKTDLVLESYEEHAVAAYELKRLLKTDPESETFKAKVVTLKELIEHHVKEEEKELFPSVEKAMASEDLTALGKKMKARFEEAVESGYEAVLAANKAKKNSAEQRSRAAR